MDSLSPGSRTVNPVKVPGLHRRALTGGSPASGPRGTVTACCMGERWSWLVWSRSSRTPAPGRPAASWCDGEPGVGKSALLAEVLSTAGDLRVLRTQGLESESPLAFAALQRLLRPILGLAERLPEPQARALGVAFGQQVGKVEPFLVGVATLSMLTEAAEE